jgi:hypothetical protein|tara:strand:+ start:942 stop:1235 length:294 start_codon:yes stop_codon:yes gene_type:complete
MRRITAKSLTGAVSQLNYELSELRDTYKPYKVGGKYKANVGTFYVNYSNGGCRLCRIANEDGGEHDVSKIGSKRETYDFIYAMLAGIMYSNNKRLTK